MTDCIDRDMLLKMISHKPSSPTTDREDRLIDGFISAVKNCPAADVRPVRHGRWLPTSDANKKRCSRCDVIHLIAQYPHGEINFCPNCGADMRGKADG